MSNSSIAIQPLPVIGKRVKTPLAVGVACGALKKGGVVKKILVRFKATDLPISYRLGAYVYRVVLGFDPKDVAPAEREDL